MFYLHKAGDADYVVRRVATVKDAKCPVAIILLVSNYIRYKEGGGGVCLQHISLLCQKANKPAVIGKCLLLQFQTKGRLVKS